MRQKASGENERARERSETCGVGCQSFFAMRSVDIPTRFDETRPSRSAFWPRPLLFLFASSQQPAASGQRVCYFGLRASVRSAIGATCGVTVCCLWSGRAVWGLKLLVRFGTLLAAKFLDTPCDMVSYIAQM